MGDTNEHGHESVDLSEMSGDPFKDLQTAVEAMPKHVEELGDLHGWWIVGAFQHGLGIASPFQESGDDLLFRALCHGTDPAFRSHMLAYLLSRLDESEIRNVRKALDNLERRLKEKEEEDES